MFCSVILSTGIAIGASLGPPPVTSSLQDGFLKKSTDENMLDIELVYLFDLRNEVHELHYIARLLSLSGSLRY